MHRWTQIGIVTWIVLGVAAGVVFAGERAGLYILQSNDMDPTAPTSQPGGRWYHWIGVDPVVTHLETAIAVDADRFARRGQRIEVRKPGRLVAVEVKIKRIGNPGPMRWEAGTGWGKSDLGSGEVPAAVVNPRYEHFVTLPLGPAEAKSLSDNGDRHLKSEGPSPRFPISSKRVFLRLWAASGNCPDDYYAVYCTWRELHPVKARVNGYDGPHDVPMMYRALRADANGAALDADGRPLAEGPSMMTRLLTDQPGPGRRQLLSGEEEPYTFIDALAAGIDPRRQGLPWPNLVPQADEVRIDSRWRIQVAAPKSPQVATAVGELETLLRDIFKLPLETVWDSNAKPQPRTITVSEGKDLAGGPRRAAGYRFSAAGDQVHLHGYDPRGVLRAVWYLEDRLTLRGGPLLRPEQRVREPRYSPRATCAAWGGMGELAATAPVYTDEHLSLISHYGYDAIWLGWYAGADDRREPPTRIMPGSIPEGTTYRPYNARLRDLIERAAKYDVEVVVQYVAPHPATDAQRKSLQDDARRLLRDVPKLRTIILLDEGMGSVNHGVKAWGDTCSLLARAFWEVRPETRVVAWRYSFFSNTPDRSAWDRRMQDILGMDRRIAYMGNFDSFWARRRDGLLQYAFDYCLSLKGPSDDYSHAAECLLAEGRRDGHPPRPLWAKIESRFSQESNVQPEIPCMQRWAERFDALNHFQTPPVASVVANWYHQGFYPTPVTELFGWMSYTNAPPTDELLESIARRDFGPSQEATVLAAWREFSEAIWHYPFYYGLAYPMNSGAAQPFWLDPKAVNTRPWRRGFVNSADGMHLADPGSGAGPAPGPGYSPGSGGENRARLAQLRVHWAEGLKKLQAAASAAPPQVRARAESHLRTARSFGASADMTARLVRWFDARDRLQKATAAAKAEDALAALAELERIGREELAATRAVLPMYLCDSRFGHLNHGRGCFSAMTVAEKIDKLEKTLHDELPALRRTVMQRNDGRKDQP